MRARCPLKCYSGSENRIAVRFGGFYRKSDRRWIQRYRCARCGKHFSQSTHQAAYGQKKRHLNHKIFQLLSSGVSQRRTAKLLQIHLTTVSRKLEFLGNQARLWNCRNRHQRCASKDVQFDDLETIEHTKLKPVSVTLAVEKKSRFIIGFEVSRMPSKGHLAKRSRKKYGLRKDERPQGHDRLFRKIQNQIIPTATLTSDENPMYPKVIRSYFPKAKHETVKGARGSSTGQGEIKAQKFDPLFSLNHTCAMFRANINRLFRKTWCTTKKLQPLIDHIEIYTKYHNQRLI